MPASATGRLPKAAVYVTGNESAWLVSETPSEIMARIVNPDEPAGLIGLTLANTGQWNGRTVYIRIAAIDSIGPPLNNDE